MTKTVFISYSNLDFQHADAVREYLESNGFACWMAPRDITPGRPYGEEILRAIRSSCVLVVNVSEHSTRSPHVRREVEAATSNSLPIIPVFLDHAQIPDAIGYYLGDHHRIDASVDFDTALDHVRHAVSQIIGIPNSQNVIPNGPNIENRNPLVEPRYELFVTQAGGATLLYPLGSVRITVGRSQDCDLYIQNDPGFSRAHFALVYDQKMSTYAVTDFGAANPTLINGQNLQGTLALDIHDVIRVSSTEFVYRYLDDVFPGFRRVNTGSG